MADVMEEKGGGYGRQETFVEIGSASHLGEINNLIRVRHQRVDTRQHPPYTQIMKTDHLTESLLKDPDIALIGGGIMSATLGPCSSDWTRG